MKILQALSFTFLTCLMFTVITPAIADPLHDCWADCSNKAQPCYQKVRDKVEGYTYERCSAESKPCEDNCRLTLTPVEPVSTIPDVISSSTSKNGCYSNCSMSISNPCNNNASKGIGDYTSNQCNALKTTCDAACKAHNW